jgi:hypothetical protein
MTEHRNRLAEETSPYLLQHAGNPVHWQPWDEEALATARRENKPILLSIGYSACHWCHVMAHECFENPAIAAQMNELFVNVKVDREERPDLDRIYQLAHQMITQRNGGWPLTMFLSPDDRAPFFGGTYFPPEPRHGLPGFPELMERVAGYWRDHQDEIRDHAGAVQEAFTEIWRARPGTTSPRRFWSARRSTRHAARSARASTRSTAASATPRSSRTPPTWCACCATGAARRWANRPTSRRSTW